MSLHLGGSQQFLFIVGKVEKRKSGSAVAQVAVTAVPALTFIDTGTMENNRPEQPNNNNNPLILLLQYTCVDGDGLRKSP